MTKKLKRTTVLPNETTEKQDCGCVLAFGWDEGALYSRVVRFGPGCKKRHEEMERKAWELQQRT